MALAGSNGGSWTTTYGKSRAKAAEAIEGFRNDLDSGVQKGSNIQTPSCGQAATGNTTSV